MEVLRDVVAAGDLTRPFDPVAAVRRLGEIDRMTANELDELQAATEEALRRLGDEA